MRKPKIMKQCFICDGEFQMGLQRYEGKHIDRYRIDVCRPCYEGSWDGWAPHCETKFLNHLRSEGIPVPPRNEHGFLPRD